MHSITDKLIREAVDVILRCFLGGQYENTRRTVNENIQKTQTKTVSPVGIYDANTDEQTMATVSPVTQTGI